MNTKKTNHTCQFWAFACCCHMGRRFFGWEIRFGRISTFYHTFFSLFGCFAMYWHIILQTTATHIKIQHTKRLYIGYIAICGAFCTTGRAKRNHSRKTSIFGCILCHVCTIFGLFHIEKKVTNTRCDCSNTDTVWHWLYQFVW